VGEIQIVPSWLTPELVQHWLEKWTSPGSAEKGDRLPDKQRRRYRLIVDMGSVGSTEGYPFKALRKRKKRQRVL